jgi:hypothetical protein
MRRIEGIRLCRLEAADVLLVHTRRSLWGWLIRLGTRCYWNHALMVCRAGDGDGYRDTLVVDAKSDGTIVIDPVGRYLDRPGKYDVAVKRLGTGHLSAAAGLRLRSYVCDVALNEIDVRVGLPILASLDRIVRQLTLVGRFIRRKTGLGSRPPALPWSIRPAAVRAFTCGGFVQWCYYQAARRMLAEGSADNSILSEVLLNPGSTTQPTPFTLLTTTPADLAGCDKLCWQYVIREGVAEESAAVTDSSALSSAV